MSAEWVSKQTLQTPSAKGKSPHPFGQDHILGLEHISHFVRAFELWKVQTLHAQIAGFRGTLGLGTGIAIGPGAKETGIDGLGIGRSGTLRIGFRTDGRIAETGIGGSVSILPILSTLVSGLSSSSSSSNDLNSLIISSPSSSLPEGEGEDDPELHVNSTFVTFFSSLGVSSFGFSVFGIAEDDPQMWLSAFSLSFSSALWSLGSITPLFWMIDG